ncbi:MAG: hypothetical protein NTX17_05805 [Candidatus Eisenbacteria bacterium]|nr:hypothetical protein [Candidatus Eisenbacteria bacterium]
MKKLHLVCIVFLVAIVLGCSSGSKKEEKAQVEPTDVIIADELVVLKDGESRTFKLDPGSYKLEVTATGDGVSVEWLGSACPSSGQISSLVMACRVIQTGQVVVKNPTGFGMGALSNATIKLIKLARDI